MLKISNVKMGIHTKQEDYSKIVSSHLNVRYKELSHVQLIKRSIDARKKDVHYICTFAFDVNNEEQFLKQHKQVSVSRPYVMEIPNGIDDEVVVVGSGPAGLFCAWLLAKSGTKVILLERGKCVEKRIEESLEMVGMTGFEEKRLYLQWLNKMGVSMLITLIRWIRSIKELSQALPIF